MYRWTVAFAAIVISSIVALGCSGGNDAGTPVVPASGQDISSGLNTSEPAQQAHNYLLGYYDVYFDINNQTMEVVENRTTNFTINIVPFLNKMTSPPNGISFGTIVLDDSDPELLLIDVEFRWHHPFPTLKQYKVYDFIGAIITDGDIYPGYTGLRRSRRGENTYMTNADGYTRWFNPTEFTTELIFGWAPGGIQNWEGNAHLNPYKYYAKGLGPDDSLWEFLESGSNNDGVFESGGGRTMSLEFPIPPAGDGLVFGYAAICCWEEQFDGPYTPYHRDESIACKVTVTDNLYYIDSFNYGGNLILDIDIWAWEEQPSEIKVESSVLTSPVLVTDPLIGGEHYSTYHLDVPSGTIDGTEGHSFWVIAESSAYNYINIEGVPAPHETEALTAYFLFPLYVADAPYNIPPIIDSGVTGEEDLSVGAVETYNVTAHDDDPGDVLSYSWTVTDNSTSTPVSGYDGVPGDGAGNLIVDFGAIGSTVGDSYDIDCDVSDGKDETAATTLTATVTNTPPVIDSGVDGDDEPFILDTETYSVTAHDDDFDPLTYSWTVTDNSTGTPVTGYDGVTGDGSGNLDVDWAAVGAENLDEYDIDCEVSDGKAPPVAATTLTVTCDNILFFDDMESGEGDWIHTYSGPNNGWAIVAGGNDGHWWHSNAGSSSKQPAECARLFTPEITIPSGLSAVHLEFYHEARGMFYSNTVYLGPALLKTENDGSTMDKVVYPVISGPQYDNWNYPYGSTYHFGLAWVCNPFNCWGVPSWTTVTSPTTSKVNVSSETGHTLRFAFAYGHGVWYAGNYIWAVDDVKVTVEP